MVAAMNHRMHVLLIQGPLTIQILPDPECIGREQLFRSWFECSEGCAVELGIRHVIYACACSCACVYMFGFGTFFRVGNLVFIIMQFMMATFNRRQSPAWHTKDSYPGPLKKDRYQKKGPVIMKLRPQSLFRQEGTWRKLARPTLVVV